MKNAKRIISIFMAVVTILSVMGIAVNAAYISTTNTKYGYMVPTDAKGTKAVSTVKLYGAYDYINFYIDSDYADKYYFYEIYSDKKYTKLMDSGYFYCDTKGEYTASAQIKLKGVYKSGTYYAVTYAAAIYSDGEARLSQSSMREFKMVVDREPTFKEQIVILKGMKTTVNGPRISWSAVSGASKYYVYRRPITGTTWTKVGTAKASATSFTDTSAKNKNGRYIYTVKAVNKSGSATRYHYHGLTCLFAKAPVITSVATGADNKIKVQWNSTSSSAYYEVYRREVGTSSWTKLASNYKKTYYNDAKAVSGKTYEYTVRANIKTADGLARSAYYGNADKAVKYLQAPNVTDVYKDETGLCVLWNEVSGATAYTVYRRPLDGSTGWVNLKKVSASTTYFVDTTASFDGEYVYTVRAEGPKGRGSYYTDGIPYINFEAPEVHAEFDSTNNTITLNWDNVPYALSYDVYSDICIVYEDVQGGPVTVNMSSPENTFFVYAKTKVVDGMTGKEISLMSEAGSVTVNI